MPEPSRANITTWKLRFRRKYAGDVAGLTTLADELAAEAGEFVTFTSTTEEGQSASGVITGNKMEMLTAAEELLGDPLFTAGISQPRPRIMIPDFSQSRPV